mmetsp:Transcript_13935/g.21251  ORF Transcript_13935/g.21251 Transcript_13935/m.21251 type:complete len:626 (+) Transcript_13935:84-1961(+)
MFGTTFKNIFSPTTNLNLSPTDRASGNDVVFRVRIPQNIKPGEEFQVVAGSYGVIRVVCPHDCLPGDSLRIAIPNPELDTANDYDHVLTSPPISPPSPPRLSPDSLGYGKRATESAAKSFEVIVPDNARPGEPFALLVEGVRVLVTCPENASPGSTIRFQVPLTLSKENVTNEAAQIKLKYDRDGWQRTIRLSDMKFQWVRVDDNGDVETNVKFDIVKSAYVRKLDYAKDDAGSLTLVPATDAAVGSKVKTQNGRGVIVSCADIAGAQSKSFEEKCKFFHKTCDRLRTPWDEGHIQINVRREFLFLDSMQAVLSLPNSDLRKIWRFTFMGEDGLDAGGLTREWFQILTEEMFDPNMGMWQSSQTNQMLLEINPASEVCCEDHLRNFRFFGRVMGKALFDRQLVSSHMVQCLYKHILGWPVTFADLKNLDEDVHRSLIEIETMVKNEDPIADILCYNFTATREILGLKEEVELVKGGADIELTNDNYSEYLQARLNYRLLDRTKPQLQELLLGFFEVIPEPLLAIFDFQELELLMCGLPQIKLEDWKNHTEYSGEYAKVGSEHKVCRWFWEIVADFDQEMKARLLQFATATSGVPPGGFGVLQSNDGNIRKFTIHGIVEDGYPRAQ